MKIGYARVSTTGQTLDAQIAALTAAGCERIFKEQRSGKSSAERIELQAALAYVRDGDALLVTRLDRLARSVLDLHQIVQQLNRKSVDLVVLLQAIDTTTPAGRLTFSLLGAIAEFERELICERAAEGRARAKQKGVKFGRKPMEVDWASIQSDILAGTQSKAAVAQQHGISRATLYRLLDC
ncbi:resolvase [Sulfuricella sp. T08]|uniref:recombinase family protein n=1 Tax=Sulfuricella sp. T08 TaxID=1632857 RepID=UPI000617A03A|nr:recombinase family protein [Sulfuricella sp. T08]GAO37408.1 resolvase [Sulfuricella sp. T08]